MIYLIFAEFGNSEDWEKYNANKNKHNSSSILQGQWLGSLYCIQITAFAHQYNGHSLNSVSLSHLPSPFPFCFLSMGHCSSATPPPPSISSSPPLQRPLWGFGRRGDRAVWVECLQNQNTSLLSASVSALFPLHCPREQREPSISLMEANGW